MKTISSRFLRAAISLVLVVMLLLSSTISGLAAVVDTAQTGAVNHSGGYVYFLKPSTWTTTNYIYLCIGHNSYTSVYQMTKVSNTSNLYRYTMPSWGGATYHAVIATSSSWESGNWGPSNLTNANHCTQADTSGFQFNSGNYNVITCTNTSKNAAITTTYMGNAISSMNSKQSAVPQSTNDGSSYTTNYAAGTTTVKGYAFTAYNSCASSKNSTSTATAEAGASIGYDATVTMTAAAKTGYEFVGWFSSTTATTATSTSATYTYTCSGSAKTMYARFKKLHTVTYNVDGVTTTEKVAAGDSPANIPTLTNKTGYTCTGWDNNPNGAVITADTTYTATYTANTYNVILDPQGGSIDDGDVTSYTYGTTTTLPTADQMSYAGYDFAGWFEDAAGTGSQILEISATETGDKTYYAKWVKNEVYFDLNTSAQYTTNGTSYSTGTTGGSATPVTTNVLSGSDVEINATPATGYEFVGWFLNGTKVSEEATYTVRVNDTATYVARFIKTYTVSVTSEDGLEARPSPDGTVVAGQSVLFKVYSIADGYRFDGWYKDGELYSPYESVTVNVTEDINLDACSSAIYGVNYEIYCNGAVKNNAGAVSVSPEKVAEGETITFTVDADDANNAFYGLFADTSFDTTPDYNYVSESNEVYTYELTMEEGGITVFPLFYKKYSGFAYNPVSNDYSRSILVDDVDAHQITIRDGEGDTVSLPISTCDGVTITEAGGTYTIDIDEINYDADQDIELTLTLNAEGKYELNASAEAKPKFAVTFANGTVGSGAGDYAVGAPVTLQIAVGTTLYLKGVKSSGATVADLVLEGTTVTFTMPEGDVEIIAEYGDKRYIRFVDKTGIVDSYEPSPNGYAPSTEVAVTITPESSAYTILDDITVKPVDDTIEYEKGTDYTVEPGENGSFIITINSMPDCDVNIATKYEAKFLMDNQVVTVGNPNAVSTAVGGTVVMTANGEIIDNTVYNDQGTEVTYTATANADYTFVGFFSDANCKKLLSTDAEYTFVPTDHTTVYALFARDQYIVGTKVTGDFDIAVGTGSYQKMTYNYKEKAYTYDAITDDLSTVTEFKITYLANGTWNTTGWNYYVNNNSTMLNYSNELSRGVTILQDDQSNMEVSAVTGSAYTAPLTIYFKPNGSKFDVYAKAEYKGAKVYLSSGRLDTCGDYTSTTVFVEPDFTVSPQKSVESTAENIPDDKIVEKYYVGTMEEAHSFTIQTNLGGNNPQNHYVDSYIIYYIDSQTYDVIPSTDIANMGANRYSASVMCQGDCYIVPIVYHTDAYLEANNIDVYTVYFDASEGDRDYWGPFVAAYVYGEDYAPNGSWPGQLMIPNDDGTSYSIRVELNPNENFQGIVFDNYLAYSVPQTECVAFGLGTDPAQLECVQTYDYKEPLYLYEEGYSAITFKMKTTTDGYHGEYADTENTTNGDVSVWDDNENILSLYNSGALDFEPLVDRSGTQLMDLTAQKIGTNLNLSPDYLVVAKGDVMYATGDYALDPDYAGKWTVEWWIYDASSGDHLTTVISGSLYDGINSASGSVLKQKMESLGHDIEGKVVNITYEFNNACADDEEYTYEDEPKGKVHHSDNDRFDGQWYGNLSNETMHTEIYVGLENADGTYTIAADNEEEYGKAYINETFQAYDVSYAVGIVNLSATPLVGQDGTVYRYDGLYIMKDGEYVKIAEAYNYSPTVTEDTVYYALFSEVGDDELLITHQPYVNYNDIEILSHNGVSTMTVDIYEYDKETETKGDLLASGDESVFLSQATIDITIGNSYLVEVSTTPLNQGKFYAWYTESTTYAGVDTYEEIMTLGEDVNKSTKVTNSFVYTASATSQRVINIYSDVTRVTNKAMLVYRYLNRFGEWRTYTIPEIVLTDDECLGYDGNNYQPYVPTYRTAYIMSKEGEPDETVYGEGDYETFTELGYKVTSSTNKIQFYAPSPDVTQAFDEEINWVVTDVQLTYQKSLVTLEATQNDPVYTVNYIIDGETDKVTGVYNTLIEDVVAPETNSAGDEFSYWIDTNTNEILSYSRFYNYRIVEDKTIMAVYGVTVGEDEWNASINSVTYTREYQDTSDYVYTDFLIDFTNTNVTAPELDEIKYSEGIKYGLIMVREANVSYDPTKTTAEQAYPDSETIIEGVKTTALAGSNQTINAGGSKYAAHCYDLTAYDTTNFNRMDYYIKYNNSVEKYRNYLWTCYAYIIENGEVKLSEPVNVSIYECATAEVK